MSSDFAEQTRENIKIFIEDGLQKIVTFDDKECSISRIPIELLNMNCSAYVPKVISIGPFHHDQHKFVATEELKFRFLNSYKSRIMNMINIQDLVKIVQSWEEKARKYYSEDINMESEEFVKMMILDGCFVVEFMITNRSCFFPENDKKVHLSYYKTMEYNIDLDLIKLENQLPFFVLQHLFDFVYLTILEHTPYDSINLFKIVVHRFLSNIMSPITRRSHFEEMLDIIKEPHHLLDFLSFYFVLREKDDEEDYVPKKKENVRDKRYYLPPNATQLSEAGVVFKRLERHEASIMDISFKNGILIIPALEIYDQFETGVRNLIAFASFSGKENVTHYFEFLDELITTEKDVNLLAKEGIIVNQIGGSQKEISDLFNNISRYIYIHPNNCFGHIARDLNQHCKKSRNKWMATLRHNYFNTPWAFVSFLGATFLILLTLLQTIFTIYK